MILFSVSRITQTNTSRNLLSSDRYFEDVKTFLCYIIYAKYPRFMNNT